MKYYLLDRVSNTWSEKLYTLQELLFMNDIDDSAVLATQDGQRTLSLGEAKATSPSPAAHEKVKMFTGPRETAPSSGKKEYKVLSQKDKWYSGKFDPSMLEKALNDYAEMGYQVICSSTATIQSLTGAREEMIIILERDKK